MSLRLVLFGPPRLERDGVVVVGRAVQRRRIALLILLSGSANRTLSRERILAFLWPEHAPDAARRLLSEAIYVVRRELGDELISSVGDSVSLSDSLTRDVDELLIAHANGDHAATIALHAAPFLDAWFVPDAPELDRWVEAERAALRAKFLHAVQATAEACATRADWSGASHWWARVVRDDPYHSTAVFHGAQAKVANGEPGAALQLIAGHEAVLQNELGVPLDRDLQSLRRAIITGSVQPQRQERVEAPVGTRVELLQVPVAVPVTTQDAQEEELVPPSLPTVQVSPVATHRARARAQRTAVFATGLLLSVMGALAISQGMASERDRRQGQANVLDPLRIAVLYVDRDTSSIAVPQHIADGLTEALIDELSRVPALNVVTRDAAERFRDAHVSADSIGRALRAGTIIRLSANRTGERIRVHARVIDASASRQAATLEVDERMTELNAIVDALSLRTAAALRRYLGAGYLTSPSADAAARDTRNSGALALLFQAERLRKDAMLARTSLARDPSLTNTMRAKLIAADSLLSAAEQLDSTDIRLPIERGWVAVAAGAQENGTARVLSLSQGLVHAERARLMQRQQRVPTPRSLAAVHHLIGTLDYRLATAVQTRRSERPILAQAQVHLDSAVLLDSTLAGAWAALSWSRWAAGNFSGAEQAAQRALEADVYLADADDVLATAWRSAYSRGDERTASHWCARGRVLLPDDWHFVQCALTIQRLHAAGLTGRKPDGLLVDSLLAQLSRIDPADRATASGRAYTPIYRRLTRAAVRAALGHKDEARKVLAEEMLRVRGDEELRTDILYDAAFVNVVLGEPMRARALLQTYLSARPDLKEYAAADVTMRGVGKF
ncbi:MAG: hypothetical protein H7099_15870 [Gemmatimonadaceae bacterium]|nr:hypothetical protein [Gemmatimonadaceae bacterium]